MPDPTRKVIELASVVAARSVTPAVNLLSVFLERSGLKLLDGLTLSLPCEGVTAIIGPNGAGKSLLLRLMAGLISPTAGMIHIHPSYAGRIALVFQRPVLLRRSVRGNLAHALRVYGVPRKQRRGRLSELLNMGGLSALAGRPARSLSGGEQQRLAMVRALVARPQLLLLDEPTASLDPQSTLVIETLVRATAQAGAKIVLVTHDHGQAQRLADEIVFLHHGRVKEQTKSVDFFVKPDSQAGRAFLEGHLLL